MSHLRETWLVFEIHSGITVKMFQNVRNVVFLPLIILSIHLNAVLFLFFFLEFRSSTVNHFSENFIQLSVRNIRDEIIFWEKYKKYDIQKSRFTLILKSILVLYYSEMWHGWHVNIDYKLKLFRVQFNRQFVKRFASTVVWQTSFNLWKND